MSIDVHQRDYDTTEEVMIFDLQLHIKPLMIYLLISRILNKLVSFIGNASRQFFEQQTAE